MRAAIICSEIDDASQNIAQRLLKRADWTRCSEGPVQWTYENLQLLITDGRLIDQEALDRRLNADLLIFASRHQSERRKGPLFTAHFTGDIARWDDPKSTGGLARAAPRALKLVVETLKRLSNVEVLIEATHHGPCAIDKPSCFVEIGSSKAEWTDEVLGDTVAKALLTLNSASFELPCPTAVGFGGPHYAVRHTDVLLGSDICFGHIFATYQLEQLTREIVEEAFEKSRAQFAYFDRKQMGADRTRIESTVQNLGYEVLRMDDLRRPENVSWELYLLIKRAVRLCGLRAEGRINVSASLRDTLRSQPPNAHLELTRLELNSAILNRAHAVDEEAFRQLMEIEKVVYLERKDSTFPAVLVPGDLNAQSVQNALVKGSVEILKQRYEVEYSQRKSKLYISGRKFNPRLARSLGVGDGPLFAKLARGETIRINSKVIKREDVFTKFRKVLDIAHADKSGRH